MLTKLIQHVKPFLFEIALFFFVFIIYLHNLSGSVYGGDSGDFLSAIAVKGVPHPSGYPLYMLFGILVSWLPIYQTLAWKVDLLSAFFSSLAVVLMYIIIIELHKNKLVAVITALLLAFTFPFWLYAETTEVFALQHFFMLLLFYIGLLLYKRKKIGYLYLLSFFTGLSFSNQELTVLILPTLFIFVFASRKKLSLSKTTIGKCLGLFLLGLLPYLYIPLAASVNPPIDWNHPTTIDGFSKLVTRSYYGLSQGTSLVPLSIRILVLQYYLTYVLSMMSLFLIAVSLFGIYALIKKQQKTILLAVLSSFLLFGPIFMFYCAVIYITYDSFNQGMYEKFFTTSIIFLLLLISYGIRYIVDFLVRVFSPFLKKKRSLHRFEIVTICLFMFAPFWLFISNFPKTDVSNIVIGNTLGEDILYPLPKHSIVVAGQDNMLFSTRYIQYAYNSRKDVTTYIPAEYIQVNKNDEKRPVFYYVQNFNTLGANDKEMPYGLLFQKINSNQHLPKTEDQYLKLQKPILMHLEKSTQTMPSSQRLFSLKIIVDIPHIYAQAFANTAFFLITQYKDYETAKVYFKKALAIDHDNSLAYEGLGDYFIYKNQCSKAEDAYENAANIDFVNKRIYQKLYKVVDGCLHDTPKAQQLREFFKQYSSVFQNNTY